MILVCIGETQMGPWQIEELEAALMRAVQDPQRKVMPVWRPQAPAWMKAPAFLGLRHGVDLRLDWTAGVAQHTRRKLRREVRCRARMTFSPLSQVHAGPHRSVYIASRCQYGAGVHSARIRAGCDAGRRGRMLDTPKAMLSILV